MVIYSLTNKPYTTWGTQYQAIHWKPSWWVFVNLAEKELKTKTFSENKVVNHLIYWFDSQIIQRIAYEKKTTLEVRIRIICGLVNKVSPDILSIEMKREFMECIWDTFNKFYRDYMDWYCKWIVGIPF